MILVLWDIDRTLLYAGDTDRLVYREVFHAVVGRPATKLPAKGTGVTMPVAVRELLAANDVQEVDRLAPLIVARLPAELRRHQVELLRDGHLMPGAVEALAAVRGDADFVPSIVTGNLRESAEIKLAAFGLTDYVDVSLGGYASDDPHRPALVRIAQARVERAHGRPFTRANTVIIGDSLQDVRTGREGGARVIGVASGTTAAEALADAGADEVLSDLTDPVRLLELIHARG
ncbi:HAD family hydrolase [Streptomyces tsukubensis]|uniref:Phosphoglycolate phosphatase n=1 Tax=Streptomyces tsukubensis TaxID=83656 RepID=A0A1V4A3E4_9ACTN|nr:haloacid dehalogenase-like hydrolase [Streptomyces tsukubensis]OON74924.1 phosphoglycolate phosphatase [Streptomyces tsukubensis]QFR94762.1 HAD hydrolase-like protein [Streptomyces tsukubensis]